MTEGERRERLIARLIRGCPSCGAPSSKILAQDEERDQRDRLELMQDALVEIRYECLTRVRVLECGLPWIVAGCARAVEDAANRLRTEIGSPSPYQGEPVVSFVLSSGRGVYNLTWSDGDATGRLDLDSTALRRICRDIGRPLRTWAQGWSYAIAELPGIGSYGRYRIRRLILRGAEARDFVGWSCDTVASGSRPCRISPS